MNSNSIQPRWLPTQLYNLLVRTAHRCEKPLDGPVWRLLQDRTKSWRSPVRTVIHDRRVIVNFGYSYPISARLYPSFNNPLLEIIHQTSLSLGRPVRVADVGAAVGDTVLLLEANCPAEVSQYVCLDGDAEFFGYLRQNLGNLDKCVFVFCQLSRTKSESRSLVRIHRGTASAQGNDTVSSQPLDEVVQSSGLGAIDVLKIDVDGFDGEVLMGATSTLSSQRPSVIFEWHPYLCQQTGNDFSAHFKALASAGYIDLIWFTKFGEFSHFSSVHSQDSIQRLAEFCLKSKTHSDWHYDVIALHGESSVDRIAVADLTFARSRKSKF